jgi:hypothetical protein
MSRNKMFNIGDRVVKTHPCFYNSNSDMCGVTIGNIGTVIGILNRYKANRAYIVQFDGKSLTRSLEHRYSERNLEHLWRYRR